MSSLTESVRTHCNCNLNGRLRNVCIFRLHHMPAASGEKRNVFETV